MNKGLGSTHAKVVLLGEHAVVYGKPAIAFPIHTLRLEAEATFTGSISTLSTPFHTGTLPNELSKDEPLEKTLSETALRNTLDFLSHKREIKPVHVAVSGFIPPARGLGSSAAVAGAIIKAIGDLYQEDFSEEEIFELVQSVEKVAHGTPSGLDAYATSSETPIWFEKGQSKPLKAHKTPALLVADTGIKGHTSQAVSEVRRRREENPNLIDSQLDRIELLTEKAGTALVNGNFKKLGTLMTENQKILSNLGVSHERLDELIDVARKNGALGAKLTGGGLGGCLVALVEDNDSLNEVRLALIEAGASSVWAVNGS